MKRKLKNILAMLLAVMLIFSATPATASAAGRRGFLTPYSRF